MFGFCFLKINTSHDSLRANVLTGRAVKARSELNLSEACRNQSEACAHALCCCDIHLFQWVSPVGLTQIQHDCFFPLSLPTVTKQPTLKCSNGQMIWPNSENNLKVSSHHWCTFWGQVDFALFKFDVGQCSCHCHILKKKKYSSYAPYVPV